MPIHRYSVNQYTVESLLTWIKTDEIAFPEFQRLFVRNAAKVRDFNFPSPIVHRKYWT